MASVYRSDIKERVFERDGGRCVVCGTAYTASPCGYYYDPEANGYPVEENMVTLCMACKCDYDNSPKRPYCRAIIQSYLKHKYKDWNEDKLHFFKGGSENV